MQGEDSGHWPGSDRGGLHQRNVEGSQVVKIFEFDLYNKDDYRQDRKDIAYLKLSAKSKPGRWADPFYLH